MNPASASRTAHLTGWAAALYPFDGGGLRLIRSSKVSPNDIYAFERAGRGYILRIATHERDYLERTLAEMEFLHYLHGRGVRVSLPLPMKDGRLAASVRAGNCFHVACAFERAGGAPCDRDDPLCWNPVMFGNWGGAMGQMHAFTKDFAPVHLRGAFDGRDVESEAMARAPRVQKTARQLAARLMALERCRDNYGLIHCDFHQGNFFVEEGQVNVFDFDDSQYGPFALDLGIALYHGLRWGLPRESTLRKEAAEAFVRAFLRGYGRFNALPREDLARVPEYMRYRQLADFAFIYRPGEAEAEAERRAIEAGEIIPGVGLEPGWFVP